MPTQAGEGNLFPRGDKSCKSQVMAPKVTEIWVLVAGSFYLLHWKEEAGAEKKKLEAIAGESGNAYATLGNRVADSTI